MSCLSESRSNAKFTFIVVSKMENPNVIRISTIKVGKSVKSAPHKDLPAHACGGSFRLVASVKAEPTSTEGVSVPMVGSREVLCRDGSDAFQSGHSAQMSRRRDYMNLAPPAPFVRYFQAHCKTTLWNLHRTYAQGQSVPSWCLEC